MVSPAPGNPSRKQAKKPLAKNQKCSKRRRLGPGAYCLAACAAGVAWPASMARAQVLNPTVLAPAAKLPQERELQTVASHGRAGLQMPKAADKKFVTVRVVTIAGAFPELAEQNAALVQKLQGKRLSLAEIYQAAAELQAAYSKSFPLATLSAPRPDFADGVVKLDVTDGVIEKLELSAVPERARELVRARLQPLVGQRHLAAAEYQRRTLLVGAIAGVSGQASTTPLDSRDGYSLNVAVVESRVAGASAITNRLPKEYGTWEFAQTFALNNALGLGEQIAGAVSSTPDFERYFSGTSKSEAYSTDVFMPIGADGLVFGAGYLMARSRPSPYFSTLPDELLFAGERVTGRFDRVYARVAYPLFLTTDLTLRIQADAEHINNRYRYRPLPLGFIQPAWAPFPSPIQDVFRDRYNVLRLSADVKYRIPLLENATFAGLIAYGRGLGGRLDSTDFAFGPPLSRLGASPSFDRLNLKGRLDVGLPENFIFSAIGRLQTSFGKPLMIPENFLLDGPEAVSGYASGTLNVDRGVTARAELSRPVNLALLGYNHLVSPYVFGAWGSGVREERSPGFFRHIWAETFGGGVRTDTNFTGTPFGESLSIEVGRDLSNIPFRNSGYRTNVTYNMRFAGDPFAPEATPAAPSGIFKKGPPDEKPASPLWEGFYAGLNAGYTWDPKPEIATAGVPLWTGIDAFFTGLVPHWLASANGLRGRAIEAGGGFAGGAQTGYNLQFGKVVAGLETDIQGSNARTRHALTNGGASFFEVDVQNRLFAVEPLATSIDHTKNVDWLGTTRARLGYLVTPRFLAYATGGVAYGEARASTFVRQNWAPFAPLGPFLQSAGATGGYSGFRVGWTIGAGLEWMFAPNLSVKAEYLHYDLGSVNYALSPLVTTLTLTGDTNVILPGAHTQFRGDVVRVGLNYFFGRPAGESPAQAPAAFAQGFYAGLNAGYGWDASPSVALAAGPIQADIDRAVAGNLAGSMAASATGASSAAANGALGGGQAGYNWLIGNYVLGVEADLQGASQKGRGGFIGFAPNSVAGVPSGASSTAVHSEKTLDWFGTLRMRGGFLVTPSLLAYGTGGFAYGGATVQNLTAHQTESTLLFLQSTGSVGSYSAGRIGWTLGGGIEWKFAPDISLKAEYLHYDLGHAQYGAGVIATEFLGRANKAALTASTRFSGDIARLGLNYHFDPIAVLPALTR